MVHYDEDATSPTFDTSEIKTATLTASHVQEILKQNTDGRPQHSQFWCISLTVVGIGVRMVLRLSDDLILGRTPPDEASNNYNYVDLSGFGAYKHGVSRTHAVISQLENNVLIRDANSSNQTLLNGKRLIPEQHYMLQTGDIISLGKLDLAFDLLFYPLD